MMEWTEVQEEGGGNEGRRTGVYEGGRQTEVMSETDMDQRQRTLVEVRRMCEGAFSGGGWIQW